MASTYPTPLHTAIKSNDVESVELLLSKGVDIYAKDEKGMIPMQILMQVKLRMFGSCCVMNYGAVDKLIDMLLKHASTDPNRRDDIKLLDFYAACTVPNCDRLGSLLEEIADVNQSVSINSTIWPGYTGLHFAAHCQNVKTIVMLITKGANLLKGDVLGVTPLDICIKWFTPYEGHCILASVTAWKDIVFSDGKTKLMDYLLFLNDLPDTRKKFFQSMGNDAEVRLPNNSPLWPTWTILHIAVTFFKGYRLNEIYETLRYCADVTIQDRHGVTPIHLAFRQNKLVFVEFLLEHQKKAVNPMDKDNLSHLHIACAVNHLNMVEKLLTIEANIDIAYNGAHIGKPHSQIKAGWTPLHIACYKGYNVLAKMLLDAGANLLQTDVENYMPIHLIFVKYEKEHLDHNAFSDEAQFVKVLNKMFQKPQTLTYKFKKPILKLFVSLLWTNEKLQNQMEKETGFTMLHVVCYALDRKKIKSLLKKKIDVDARVREDSPIWAGFTALHVLISLYKDLQHHEDVKKKVDQSLELLLSKKADVTLTNADGDTPIHLIVKYRFKDQARRRASLLMKYHRDFSINPTNKDGLSHFHIACLVCNVTAVKGFLQHGADVNQVAGESAGEFAGKSPLHFTLDALAKPSFGAELQLQTVDLLLEHGANVNAVDARGWTPLHNVAMCGPSGLKLLDRIVRSDTDMNKETIDGQTPFEILIQCGASMDQIKYFIDRGSRVNTYNRVSNKGYMAMIIAHAGYRELLNDILDLMMSLPDIAEVDERGRNALYNTLCGKRYFDQDSFAALIEKLIKLGCDLHQKDRQGKSLLHVAVKVEDEVAIAEFTKLGCDVNQQDNEGKTPLHVAVESQGKMALDALLTSGADVNLVDFSGKSPFSYCFKKAKLSTHEDISTALIVHLEKLQMVRLEVSQLNLRLLTEACCRIKIDEHTLHSQLEQIKEVKIGERGLTLYDFVFEKNVVKIISSFTKEERDIVGSILDSTDYTKFSSLRHLLKLQYRQVLERLSLIAPAVISLNILTGSPLDDLCVEIILKYLNNLELKNLISATT